MPKRAYGTMRMFRRLLACSAVVRQVPTQGPSLVNRNATVRRIMPLLTGENEIVPLAPR
jgi:hypothetical protein